MNDIIERQVREMKRGDESAFDWLYSAYVEKLYRMAFLITGNRNDSEDIVQETFVKCYLQRESLREERAFESWLYQILVRTAWRYQKKKKNDYSLDELTGEEAQLGMGQRIQLDDSSPSPLEEILKEEQNRAVYQAIQKLDIKQRTVVTLYYFNEMPVSEIARITGSFAGTVKSRLFKARQNLRDILEQDEKTAPEKKKAPGRRTAAERSGRRAVAEGKGIEL